MSSDYLTLEDILFMHSDLIERFGGSKGVRDPGLLEAAIFRPQTGYYPDVIAEAAALWESLSQNHPFVDGNKRAAFAACYVFLEINGAALTATNAEAERFILNLYDAGAITFENLEAWLRENTARG